ncbi:Antirestriction protein ArdC (plasmid) [Carboxydocella thermautotrophica]|nr:Antirestriction protein ArdC [Carboxydocella thermautotrophica]
MSKVYEIVTERIIKKLEQGTVPWRQPWRNAIAVNWKTQKPYRGINCFLLEPGEYATWNQIMEAGGKVRPEEAKKFQIVVFWKWLEKEDGETGEIDRVPLLRYYKVYEINRQCEGLESRRKDEIFEHDPIEEAEKILAGYKDAPRIEYQSGQASYNPHSDSIKVPPLQDYRKAEEYYCTLFHELVHSTGHLKRLNRPGFAEIAAFASETYSKEELIAELGAAMLCAMARIDNSTIDNSASYIASWLRKLKNDKRLIVQAAASAQKAVDYILGHEADC